MWKIQIFIFVEAVLLTLAAITILSIDFSRFVVLMVLFCSFCITILANKSKFSINRAECALVFYRDAESFCDCSHFICGGLWFIDRLPLYV